MTRMIRKCTGAIVSVALIVALPMCSDSETACPSPRVLCDGVCVDLDADRANCGACDVTCVDGQICDGAGVCAATCQAGLTLCDETCVDTDRDAMHCGACAAPCEALFLCDGSGECALSCQAGLVDCGGTCTNTSTDPRHCGACDDGQGSNTCLLGLSCVDGGCELTCPNGLTDCGGQCIDTDVDRSHCGGCDDGQGSNTCDAGEVCNGAGVCALSCQAGLTDCGGMCTDTDVDAGNCGGCDDGLGSNVCEPGEVCNGLGLCDVTCQTGLTDCSGVCTDTDVDRNNCGGCDEGQNMFRCVDGEVCDGSGSCALNCGFGLDACGNNCIDLEHDPVHCGACNSGCLSGLCGVVDLTPVACSNSHPDMGGSDCQRLFDGSELVPTCATTTTVSLDCMGTPKPYCDYAEATCMPDGCVENVWWMFDMGAPTLVNEVAFLAGWWNDRPRSYQIWRSDSPNDTPNAGASLVYAGAADFPPHRCVDGEVCAPDAPDSCCPAGVLNPQDTSCVGDFFPKFSGDLIPAFTARYWFFLALNAFPDGDGSRMNMHEVQFRGPGCVGPG